MIIIRSFSVLNTFQSLILSLLNINIKKDI